MANFRLLSFPGPGELAEAVAQWWLEDLSQHCGGGSGGDTLATTPYAVALSGGRIASRFATSVVTVATRQSQQEKFRKVHYFWADERCVPPNDPESNYRVANEFLFAALNIPEQQIHRVRGEEEPARAVLEGERELRKVLGGPESVPSLDVIFLGMGEDGHVASLFPGAEESGAGGVYWAVTASKPPPQRITLTYQVIAAAREVVVLASGAGKEKALQQSVSSSGQTPLAKVLRARQSTLIFSDIEAAEKF